MSTLREAFPTRLSRVEPLSLRRRACKSESRTAMSMSVKLTGSQAFGIQHDLETRRR